MAKRHIRKCVQPFYNEVACGRKKWELRNEDEGLFRVGDYLVLREWDGKRYTGEWLEVKITFVLRGYAGLTQGYAMLSIERTGRDCYGMPRTHYDM